MKKQFRNSKPAFNKTAVTELNDTEINQVNGGGSSIRTIPITIFIATLL